MVLDDFSDDFDTELPRTRKRKRSRSLKIKNEKANTLERSESKNEKAKVSRKCDADQHGTDVTDTHFETCEECKDQVRKALQFKLTYRKFFKKASPPSREIVTLFRAVKHLITNLKSVPDISNIDFESYQCETCGNLFADATTLERHRKSHPHMIPDLKYKCSFCPYSCNRINEINNHKRTHTGEKPYKCHQCQKYFRRKSHLTRHTNEVHSNKKDFKCLTCHKTFNRASDLRNHQRVHSKEKPFLCSICGKGFAWGDVRLNHEKSVHRGERPYQCPHSHCDSRFAHLRYLKRHIIRIHSKEIQNCLED